MQRKRTKFLDERAKRLRNAARREKRFERHPRWDDIIWVVGYVDAYGAVHAKVLFTEDRDTMHGDVFPQAARYKMWRWCKSEGLIDSSMNKVKPTNEDFDAINRWLKKNGCLNSWEL